MTAGDRDFVAAFRDGSLPASAFHHRDHVRMAWLYVCEFGLDGAQHRFVSDLKQFAVAKGVPGLYHATITHAYLSLVAERLAALPDADWDGFAAAHPELFAWKPGVLDAYYSAERLWSAAAREQFLLPDRMPAPPTP